MRERSVYNLTRRRGKSGTVTRVTAVTTDPKTGEKTPTEVATAVRWLYKEPTQYTRLLRAQATQQKVGDTTFVIYTPDVTFTTVGQSDYITYEGKRYEALTSTVEGDGLVITAREFV